MGGGATGVSAGGIPEMRNALGAVTGVRAAGIMTGSAVRAGGADGIATAARATTGAATGTGVGAITVGRAIDGATGVAAIGTAVCGETGTPETFGEPGSGKGFTAGGAPGGETG